MYYIYLRTIQYYRQYRQYSTHNTIVIKNFDLYNNRANTKIFRVTIAKTQ